MSTNSRLSNARNRVAGFSVLSVTAWALAGCAGTGPGARAGRECPDTIRVAETRIVGVGEADKLTLGTAVERMSQSLLRAPEGSSWKPEAARAVEIRDSRTDLSLLVEDAEWVLALSAALEGPLSTEDKASLRRLHERYAARAPHAEIAAQVTALLENVRDEGLRRDLKKLANRSWERERRAGGKTNAAASPSAPTPASASAETPATSAPALPADMGTAAPLPPVSATDSAAPDAYCADRRAEAAAAFAEARNAPDAGTRERLLQRSLAALDACITRFPDAPEAAKARQNRERVSGELKR